VRFARAVRHPEVVEVPDFTNSHDSKSAWLCKYNVRTSIYRVFIVSFFSL
jgi:hypothetical protein